MRVLWFPMLSRLRGRTLKRLSLVGPISAGALAQ